MFYDPINPLPRKCPRCGFPDLDHVPQPYFLMKGRTMSSNELAGAECGNFFIRERVRQVLDIVVPGQCTYYPTTFRGTSNPTPWLLAVPKHQAVTGIVQDSISRCTECSEPLSAHPGSQWSKHLFKFEPPCDIFKSSTWASSELGWDKWICRSLHISVRLLHLLKKIKARGFNEATCQKPVAPDEDESNWINQKLLLFEKAGIALHAEGTLSEEDAKWLRNYIKTHSRKAKSEWDIKAAERRVKAKLPKSYLDFIKAVGPVSFDHIDEEEGFTASILPPNKLAIEGGYDDFEDDESKAVNAVTFATTGHGDCFCFDAQKGRKEFSVVLYKHEGNFFEPYADNFAACIKRFASGNGG